MISNIICYTVHEAHLAITAQDIYIPPLTKHLSHAILECPGIRYKLVFQIKDGHFAYVPTAIPSAGLCDVLSYSRRV